MGQPKWLRWLHRIGYVTTAVVTFFALWIAYLALDFPRPGQNRSWDGEATRKELAEAWQEYGGYGGNAVLASLPNRSNMVGSGLRIVLMPSFSDWFGLGLYRQPDGSAICVLSRQQQPEWGPEKPLPPIEIDRHSFRLSADEYREFYLWFDRWLREYGQQGRGSCLDGSPVAFERVRGVEILSGMGNCERHYALLRQQTLALAKRHLPNVSLPADPNWHERED